MTGLSRQEMRLADPAVPVREKWKLRAWRLVRGTGVNAFLIGVVLILALLAGVLHFGAAIGIASQGLG